MSLADTKAHKTGPARLLTDEDISALEVFDEGYGTALPTTILIFTPLITARLR